MPEKLFISYPSESWNFAQRIAENLASRLEQSVFIDYRSIDQADFAASILSHLRDSDALILVVTNFTFEDIHRDTDWVRLEIRTALAEKIPIVLVRENGLLPPRDLPDDVRDINRSQGIPFYREFFEPGIDMLAEFLIKIGVASQRITGPAQPVIQPTPPPEDPPPPEPQRPIGGQGSIGEALDLLEAGDFEKALVILTTLNEHGGLRRLATQLVSDLTAQAQAMQALAVRRREAELDYETIVSMARRKLTEANARAAFAEWCQTYPELIDELDTEGLKARFSAAATKPTHRSADLLPAPFDWVEIPGGRGTLKTDEKGVTLDKPTESYWISKYPVTNAQFALFIEAGGYDEQRWWTDGGWQKREQEKWMQPDYWQDAKWNGVEQPVVGVSWYEAVAFCLWLSEVTGERIMLPTEAQWQYAAQSDDGRAYPWGPDWDCKRCNNSVNPCDSDATTPVRQHEGKSDSPFGVVDMAGNVWEWCLTDYGARANDINRNATYRVLRGGAWGGDVAVGFRCVNRLGLNPPVRNYGFGFRRALS